MIHYLLSDKSIRLFLKETLIKWVCAMTEFFCDWQGNGPKAQPQLRWGVLAQSVAKSTGQCIRMNPCFLKPDVNTAVEAGWLPRMWKSTGACWCASCRTSALILTLWKSSKRNRGICWKMPAADMQIVQRLMAKKAIMSVWNTTQSLKKVA